ncbi:MAG: hypothetical protein GY794_16710, partial [bacterium]|nr:hypothetical protein [bacterium]
MDSITGDVTNPEDGSLDFQIIDGPLWLVMAANGELSGEPTIADIGTNNFMVRATALSGKSVDTTLEITVLDAFTGELGMADLAGFAANWAMTGCADIPACGGADLTGDSNVTMDDFAKFASNWLSSSAFAKVISVDLDTVAGTVTGDFTGSFTTGTTTWNSLVIGGNGFIPNLATPLTSGALITMDGTIAEGVQFTFGGTGQTYNCATYGSTAPIALRSDYAFLRA